MGKVTGESSDASRNPAWYRNGVAILSLAIILVCCIASLRQDLEESSQQESATKVSTQSWRVYEMREIQLRFKLPKEYTEKRWEVSITSTPRRSFTLGYFDTLDLTVESGDDATPEQRKFYRPLNSIDFKEWTELIGNHRTIVQTFQGGVLVVGEDRNLQPYRVSAVCVLDASHVLRINSVSSAQKGQEVVLAMLQSMEFYGEEKESNNGR